jgi:chorismate-pyruvate lyase
MEPDDLPEPDRRLLVHKRHMTATLEAAFGQRLELRVLTHILQGNVLSRHVLLLTQDGTPVEMGAIRIELGAFPETAQQLILEATKPLGAILRFCGLEANCDPLGYFEIVTDAFLRLSLPMLPLRHRLYGRRTRLSNAAGRTLADVIEILPGIEVRR